ncbi:transposase [Terrisporobacter vanillatitrophus]|uniref:transposase n=1 Tax=Terrisporobacter vanillatitrophus TaxID=3058402 RepID=UPI003EBE0FFD
MSWFIRLCKKYIDSFRKDTLHNNSIEINNYDYIERKYVVNLLYNRINNLKIITTDKFEDLINKYEDLRSLFELVDNSKYILLNKNSNKLDSWIEEGLKLNIHEVNSFISGIQRDIVAVKNGIDYEYNNGLVEGKVNKIKVIKRIMYGKCGFETLKRKVLLLE